MRKRVLLIPALLLLLFLIPVSKGNAAAGTTGAISVSSTTVLINTVVSVGLESLTASSNYDLRFTPGCHDNITFTTASTETERIFHVKLDEPTSGETCTIELGNTTGGAAGVLDSIDVSMVEGDTFIGSAFILDILAPIAILGVAAVLLGTFAFKRMKG
ncbi:MAG: hypothetical protein ACFFDT_08020 [Candidatus Hodarchaeota archaeon]